ncbi:MFS transporter [Mesorhizobium sp. Z1-4]|uniref:MFS transporter n=1 Tax=Mesorhizobium sp. Z1-4 TaxID=2448478 RepID=UPI0013DF8A2E|nr:MFS transporter [Mesorhizobium sp. Z1-4]
MTISDTNAVQNDITAPSSGTPRGSWIALLLLSAAQFMLILDLTIVNIALPDLSLDLGLTGDAAGWVITAYAIPFGLLMLPGGRAADRFGSRRIFLIGLVMFTISSMVAGLAINAPLLIAARAGQGVSAALMSPAALATITAMFDGTDRNRALGIWGSIGAVGGAAGVLIGGLLTGGPGWRWIFYINVPVGLAIAALLPMYAPYVTPAADRYWSGFLRNFRVVRDRAILSGLYLMVGGSALMFAIFFLLSFVLQSRLGWSPVSTGLMFLPVALGTVVGAQLAGHIVSHMGVRLPSVLALAIAGLGLALQAYFLDQTWILIGGATVAALGLGVVMVAATIITMGHAGENQRGFVSGLLNTLHELGGAAGVAGFSALAASSIATPELSAEGFVTSLLVGAGFAAVATVISIVLVPGGRPKGDVSGFVH